MHHAIGAKSNKKIVDHHIEEAKLKESTPDVNEQENLVNQNKMKEDLKLSWKIM